MAELRKLRLDRSHALSVRQILGRDPDWRSEETIRLGLQDWQSARSDQKFSFTSDDLAQSVRCPRKKARRNTKVPDPISDAKRMTEAIIQTVLEAKLLTYRNF